MNSTPTPGPDGPEGSLGPPVAPGAVPPPAGALPGVPSPPGTSPEYAPPPGYTQFAPGSPSGPQHRPRSGYLLAGGIVAVILALFVGFIGLAVTALGEAIGDWGAGDLDDVIIVIGLAILGFGIFGFVGGIGAILRKQWGKVCSIIFGGIGGLFSVAGLTSDGDTGGSFVSLLLFGAVVVLCAIGPGS